MSKIFMELKVTHTISADQGGNLLNEGIIVSRVKGSDCVLFVVTDDVDSSYCLLDFTL